MPLPIRTLERARVFAPRACVWLVACSVLIFQPGGLFRFTWIKIAWLLLAVGIGALVQAGGRLQERIRWAMWALAAVLALSMAFSANPLASLLGRWPRFEGALVIALYFAVFALGAKVLGGPGRAQNWAAFRTALTPAVVIVSVVSAFEAAGFRPLGGAADLRPGATLGNATDQGIIGVLAAAAFALPAMRGRNWSARIGLVAAVLTTVLSASRAAIIGLAAVVLVLTAVEAATRATGRARVAAAGGTALFVLGAAAVAIPVARERLFSADTVNGRWLLWTRALNSLPTTPGSALARAVSLMRLPTSTHWSGPSGWALPFRRTRRIHGFCRPPQQVDFRCCWGRRCWLSSFFVALATLSAPLIRRLTATT